jgi:SET domain-containing protein
VSVTIGPSPIQGKGVFAGERIRKGEPIGRFEGTIVGDDEEAVQDPRVIRLEDQSDGRAYFLYVTNEMYFLNHSDNPNAGWRGREVFALRTISRGEEILINYWPRRPPPRVKRLRRRVRKRLRLLKRLRRVSRVPPVPHG